MGAQDNVSRQRISGGLTRTLKSQVKKRFLQPGRQPRGAGFSVVELLIVIAIVLVVCSASMIAISTVLKSARSDNALQIALGQVRQVHQRAIDERRIYRLTFSTPGNIRTDRMDLVSGVWTPVFIDSINLPSDIQFTIVSGTPTSATPNGFGTAAAAIDLSVNNSNGITQAFFQPDGRVLDSVNRVANGIVYIARPGELDSSRAVTVFGATGRVKAWKLYTSTANKYWGQP